ncbi:MAG: hypothetical protein ACFNVK_07130 [Prevotella sp.]
MQTQYKYDPVDNILGISNVITPKAPKKPKGLGGSGCTGGMGGSDAGKEKKEKLLDGAFSHTYACDELNRLIFTMDIMGKFINRIATSFIMLFLLNCCFPNFAPRSKESQCVDVDSGKFVLITQIGVIDQEYPYSVYYIMNNDSVLACKGYGIKMIRMKDDTLMIKLDGEILYHRDKIKKYRVKLLSLK